MEPATTLTASQNYRRGRGGGRQGIHSGYGRNSGGRGCGGRQGSRPPYDGQQHGSNNSLHSFGSGGQSSSSGIVQLVKSVRKQDTPLLFAGFGMRRAEIVITVPIMHLKPAPSLHGCWILGQHARYF